MELRILSQLTGSSLVLALNFEIAPGFVPDPRRVHPVVVLGKLRIAVEIKAGQMLILGQLSKDVCILLPFGRFVPIKHLFHVLFAARMMLVGSPVGVELMTDLPVLFLLVCFLNERVLQELWPGESLTWRLVEQALEERFELGGHVVGELHRVLHDQVDQRVDAIRVKGRRAHEQFVDDDS